MGIKIFVSNRLKTFSTLYRSSIRLLKRKIGFRDPALFFKNKRTFCFCFALFTLLGLYSCRKHVVTTRVISEAQNLRYHPEEKNLSSSSKHRKQFFLIRLLGNDIPGRHNPEQTINNLVFILKNEPIFPEVHRFWLVYNIVNESSEARIIQTLVNAREKFKVFKYNKLDILNRKYDWTFSFAFYNKSLLNSDYGPQYIASYLYPKSQVVANINRARNIMIEIGIQSGSEYILPWDGNCFISKLSWSNIQMNHLKVSRYRHISKIYYGVSLRRLLSNNDVFKSNVETTLVDEEPQLIFHRNATARFNENLPYGFINKVEMLWRLRIKGKWDTFGRGMGQWKVENIVIPPELNPKKHVENIGWVLRLSSGLPSLDGEMAGSSRARLRMEGLETLLAEAFRKALQTSKNTTVNFPLRIALNTSLKVNRGYPCFLTKRRDFLEVMHNIELKKCVLHPSATFNIIQMLGGLHLDSLPSAHSHNTIAILNYMRSQLLDQYENCSLNSVGQLLFFNYYYLLSDLLIIGASKVLGDVKMYLRHMNTLKYKFNLLQSTFGYVTGTLDWETAKSLYESFHIEL